MNNRLAFIDFVRGLLTINPLERWSPQQAKLHPFITQQKFTGPFQPPMNLKTSALTKSPAPGLQQQQQAEMISRQRQQQAQAQAQSAAQSAYANMQTNSYPQSPATHAPPIYTTMYTPNAQAPLPPYPASGNYAPSTNVKYGSQAAQIPAAYPQQPGSYIAATRSGRPRASTVDQQQSGIPATLARVAGHLDPTAPIRLQPSPAYYPPPPGEMSDGTPGSARRQGNSRATGARGRNFVQTLEDRTLEEGFMNQSQWHA